MTEATQETQPLRGTATFSRKISDGNYGSSEFGLYVQFDIEAGSDNEAIVAEARKAAAVAKAVVFEQLGIEHRVESDTGLVVEALKSAFGADLVEAAPKPAAPAAGGDSPPHAGTTRNPDEKRANKAWGEKHYAAHPEQWTDQRAAKTSGEINPKSPDVKHASGVGLWLS